MSFVKHTEAREGKPTEKKMSEFSCRSQPRNDLQIGYPGLNNGRQAGISPAWRLRFGGCDATGSMCGNRDLRESSSVNAHSSPERRDHVTVQQTPHRLEANFTSVKMGLIFRSDQEKCAVDSSPGRPVLAQSDLRWW